MLPETLELLVAMNWLRYKEQEVSDAEAEDT
jgi:hypothetical protein